MELWRCKDCGHEWEGPDDVFGSNPTGSPAVKFKCPKCDGDKELFDDAKVTPT